MGLVKPCSVSVSPYNTGVDCQVKMAAPKLIILMSQSAKWTDEDEEDFLAFVTSKCHDVPSKRWFPMFGNKFPLRTLNDGKGSDVTVTYDDQSIAFITNGTITRTLLTNKGGLALAKVFLSMNRFSSNLAFIEIDKFNNVLRRRNDDGSLSGIPLNVAYAPLIESATLKTEWLNAFSINYTADDYIGKGEIAYSEENLLDLTGLVNSEITDAGGSTTTKLKIGVQTIGAQTNLVELFNPATGTNPFADVSMFVVTKAGATITPTAAAYASGHIELTIAAGTSGDIYEVAAATAAVWKAAGVEFYEGIKAATITIP
jgi:hypothetical protein